ncbi:hypothetical protein GU90_02240 [Saccharopolyspora rectivirgula]|uniref:Uncharacterized protein n=1 Tax=Saccharopolyspora rectivirgula TaxID=28042 RepID=A0A073B3B5_9PSEU|nr:hypothetical protein GU90_02240 [Saccharopolyspora rectivirgula]
MVRHARVGIAGKIDERVHSRALGSSVIRHSWSRVAGEVDELAFGLVGHFGSFQRGETLRLFMIEGASLDAQRLPGDVVRVMPGCRIRDAG